MVVKTEAGYKAKVYDRGWVTMCEIVNGEWQDCIFETEEEAQAAIDRYKEFWKD